MKTAKFRRIETRPEFNDIHWQKGYEFTSNQYDGLDIKDPDGWVFDGSHRIHLMKNLEFVEFVE